MGLGKFTGISSEEIRGIFKGPKKFEGKLNYVFYVVRHGQSEHNNSRTASGMLHHKLDTELITIDDDTIKDAGTVIQDDLTYNHISKYFVSDLLRTRQTLDLIIQGMRINPTDVIPTVLPCASEVADVGKDGDCDESVSIMKKGARENYPSCTFERTKTDVNCKADWSVYFNFYGQKMRGQDDTFSGMFRKKTPRMRCRNTNMLALAIYSIGYDKYFNQDDLRYFMYTKPSGGSRRTRKNHSRRTRKNRSRRSRKNRNKV